jgi:beta-glucosidase-like glycosyl hydrolase
VARRLLPLVVLTAALLAGCGTDPVAQPPAPGPTSSSPDPTPSPTPGPTATPTPVDPVAQAIAGLDRRAQVAQLFVVGVPADDPDEAEALVRDTGVGGVFLRGRSSAGAAALAGATGSWAALTSGPRPWVAADQEGGQVQTLSGPGFPALPPAVEQGRLAPAALADLADGLGSSLAAAGVDLDLAPVADVVPAGTEEGNAPIGHFDRQYGSTAEQVRAAVGPVLRGLDAHGVTGTLKHFPGLGRVTANTDTTARVVDDVTTADDPQVRLFGELAGAAEQPFVMMSTAVYTRLDGSAPAAFSRAVVTGLLREQLGFDGVVISDDLATAEAVQDVSPGQRAVRFLAAGGTLVLVNRTDPAQQMIDAVLAEDAADPGFAATVDDAVRTALTAKARAGLLPG